MESVSPQKRYAEFFTLVDRHRKRRVVVAGTKPGKMRPKVQIVRPERLIEFIERVGTDPEIDPLSRALTCMIAWGGGRISEILNLRKKDCRVDPDGSLWVTIRVLKKDRETARKNAERRKQGLPELVWYPIERECKVPRQVQAVVEGVIARLRAPHERLFRISRFQALRVMKRLFGPGMETHSFRHGYVSFLGDVQEQERHEIMDLMKITESTVATYFHIADKKARVKGFGGDRI